MSKSMKNLINLSTGLPDFDVAPEVKAATIEAVEQGRNAYTVTRDPRTPRQAQALVDAEFRAPGSTGDRHVATSNGCCSRLDGAVNPADEVIIFDPYFVMYSNLVAAAGGTTVLVDTYPDFRIDIEKVAAAITGTDQVHRGQLAGQPDRCGRFGRGDASRSRRSAVTEGVLLISDEVYRAFCYDDSFATPRPGTITCWSSTDSARPTA